MIRLIQLAGPDGRRVALVEEPHLRLLAEQISLQNGNSDATRKSLWIRRAIVRSNDISQILAIFREE